jgi:hypothetical protein
MVGRPRAASVPLEVAKLDEESGPRDRYRSTRFEYESFWMMAQMTTACLVCLGAVQDGCNLEDLHRGHGRRRARPLCCRRRASLSPAGSMGPPFRQPRPSRRWSVQGQVPPRQPPRGRARARTACADASRFPQGRLTAIFTAPVIRCAGAETPRRSRLRGAPDSLTARCRGATGRNRFRRRCWRRHRRGEDQAPGSGHALSVHRNDAAENVPNPRR